MENRRKPRDQEIRNFKPHGVSSEIAKTQSPEHGWSYGAYVWIPSFKVEISQEMARTGPETVFKMCHFDGKS